MAGPFFVFIPIVCDSCHHEWEHRHETLLRCSSRGVEYADLPEALKCPCCGDHAGEPVKPIEA